MSLLNSMATIGLKGVNTVGTHLPLRPHFADSPEAYIEAAMQTTGLDNMGDPSFRPWFDQLVHALATEARLNAFGVMAARRDLHNLLVGRLKLEQAYAENPAIAEEEIAQPLIIIGLPRAATTHLHGLLAQDPANRAPLNWEIMHPFPRPGDSDADDVASIQKATRGLWWFHRLSGDLARKHRIAALYPQECVVIMSYAFQGIRFDSVYHLPEFQRAMEAADLTQAYRWHKRFLQYLQHGQPKRRWVLKAPSHLLSLEALLKVYPDAKLIQVNRDPVKVLPSLIGLTGTLQKAFTQHRDPQFLKQQIVDRWERTLPNLPILRERLNLGPEQIRDFTYTAVTRDALQSVNEIYQWMGWPLTPHAEQALGGFKSSRGSRRYTLEDFGLSRDDLHARFQPYLDAYQPPLDA